LHVSEPDLATRQILISAPDPLLELTHRLDLHGIIDLHQNSRPLAAYNVLAVVA
jgi:hypothetical protein